MFAFPEYGAFFGVENGRLLIAPMNVDGSIDSGSVGEVEDFEPKGFIRVMREYFGNSFWVPPALAYATITIRHNSGVTTQAMWAYTAGSQRQEELAFHEALTYAIRTFGDWR